MTVFSGLCSLVIDDLSFGFAEIGSIKTAVRIQDLAMAYTYRIPFHFRRIDFYDTGKILSEIKDRFVT